MKKSDITKLRALRAAWDKLKACEERRTDADLDAFYKVFWKYGMERQDELAVFNDEMCMQLLREHRTAYGECDGCTDYDGTPPCVQMYAAKACYHTRVISMTREECYHILLLGIRAGQGLYDNSKATTVASSMMPGKLPATIAVKDGFLYCICPPGHGFYYRYDNTLDELSKDYFSLKWIP